MTEKEFLEDLLIASKTSKDRLIRIIDPYEFLPIKEKITQFYLTSCNIKVGNWIAERVKEQITLLGANVLESRVSSECDIDIYFTYKSIKYFIEMKMRDDHDSTKKQGQVQNYITKRKEYLDDDNNAIMWFFDPYFNKNQAYYQRELNSSTQLVYGSEINERLRMIFSDKIIGDFFKEIEKIFFDYKERQASQIIHFTFTSKIDLSKVSIDRLINIFSIGKREDMIAIFFAGEDPTDEILQLCAQHAKSKKYNTLKELMINDTKL